MYQFQFDYDRVNNSYYSLVRGETTQQLIHDEVDRADLQPTQKSVPVFAKTATREQFYPRSTGYSETRFLLTDKTIKTKVLSQNHRVKLLVPFNKQTQRPSDFIEKGGNASVDLASRSKQVMYDIYHKDKFTMANLDKGITLMAKQVPRKDP